ncbi:E3 ubiquitin-protein ligase MPSR1-like [Primulina eburnea]|uniref:E3 ubiquitin-protein ligase MPSR1-like n=1 Tax=Primulina eburnea TaxID=1245227 RepID=UPI003C6C34A6
MASEAGSSDSRNGEASSFLPFILGLNLSRPLQDSASPSPESQNLDRIILINPFTQGMVVVERTRRNGSSTDSSVGLDSLLRDMFSSKKGQPPASKESIEALERVEIEKDGEECVICLEEWAVGELANEMPCKHIFHGGCIEKWLRMHGSCPVCRYKMPVDEDDDSKGKSSEENGGERRRDIWMRLIFSSDRGSGEDTGSSDSSFMHQEVEDLR